METNRKVAILFNVITDLCSEVVDETTVSLLEQRVHQALALIERDFPLTLQVIVFHLLHHLPAYLKKFGPTYSFWMYPYERFNSWITRRVLNKRYPESIVIETYHLSVWASFMQVSNQLPNSGVHQDYKSTAETDLILSDEQVQNLQTYYYHHYPNYRSFLDEYQSERELAEAASVEEFSPVMCLESKVSFKLICTESLQNVQGISNNAQKIKYYTFKDSHGCLIPLSTIETEKEHSHYHSSYVSSIILGGKLTVGRIVTIF